MRKHLKTLLAASTLAAGLATAPTIYADDSGSAGSSMMGRGMMGQGGMMGQMSSMMENCSQMMQAMRGDGHEPARPNEQWRDGQLAPEDLPRPQTPHR
jgi:Spy/CpxP family protein refolding chaperone